MSDVTRPVLPDPEPGDDLATNRPGHELRQRSEQLRQAHPVLTLIGRIFNIHNNERAWSEGADGEVEVARRLRKLGEGWKFLHGVPVGAGDSDIDHVVIGPAGVFTINTKIHRGGRVSVNNQAIYVNGTFGPISAIPASKGNAHRNCSQLAAALARARVPSSLSWRTA